MHPARADPRAAARRSSRRPPLDLLDRVARLGAGHRPPGAESRRSAPIDVEALGGDVPPLTAEAQWARAATARAFLKEFVTGGVILRAKMRIDGFVDQDDACRGMHPPCITSALSVTERPVKCVIFMKSLIIPFKKSWHESCLCVM